jgi:cytochrome c oxidase subunit 2
MLVRPLVAAASAVFAGSAWAVGDMPGGPAIKQINLTEGVTRIAAEQWWIHNFLMVVCLIIFVAVFGVMFYSIWAHRKSRGAKPADFHEITLVEIAWILILRSASAANIVAATPAWLRMPTPTTETLATLLSAIMR